MEAFYEGDPSKTYFNGYVQINTSNTGEQGRDTGCNISTLGTIKIVPGTQNLTVTNIARLKSREVKFDELSNDYIVTIDLTWQRKTWSPNNKIHCWQIEIYTKSKSTVWNKRCL